MTINFTFNVILLIIGIVVGVIAALSLLIIKANKEANKFLSALVLICVGALLHNFLISSGIYNQKPELYFLPVVLPFGIGPLLYLFVNRLIFLQPIGKKIIVLHLLPLIVQFSFYLFCFLQPGNVKYDIYSNIYQPFITAFELLGTYLSISIYIYLSFNEINSYKLYLNDYYSNTEKIALQWLKRLLYIFMFYYIISICFILVSYIFKISTNYFPSDFIRCIIIFMIGVYAVNQRSLSVIQQNIQTVIEEGPTEQITNSDIIIETTNIPHSIFSKPQVDKKKEINNELLNTIIQTVQTQKLYLNEELTISDLAKKLGYSTKTISYTINNGLQKSFSVFINEYRVNQFKEMRLSGNYDHLSIMGLAYDCGFSSKSTFNRIYKEITGSLPKEQKTNI